MATYATSSKQWTEQALAALPQEGVFRLRGLEVTRLDTFVDAAYAFVLTLLVISFDDIPSDYAEMLESIKRIPGFFASFVVLMLFWLSHRKWSRRFGLENNATLLISLAMIFMVLVYVYPLRMVFESMFKSLSGGFFSSTFTVASHDELRGVFIYYSIGFAIMAALSAILLWTTLRSAGSLSLNTAERSVTRVEAGVWLTCMLLGLLSVGIALSASNTYITLAGFIYFFTYPLIWVTVKIMTRRSG
jgi:uncharacterized membrane protein